MLSDRAVLALTDLDHGARLNCVHSVARELIAAELAIDDFGFLRLTEAGRRVARGKARALPVSSDDVADLSYRIDPMANPAAAAAQMFTPPPEKIDHAPSPIWNSAIAPDAEIASAVLAPAVDQYTRALRAAGVATGVTGMAVDVKWVHAFIEAFVDQT